MNNEYQPNVVPFGKYKGQPADVLAADPKYIEWLSGQGWVKDKYPQFYTVIINNFQEPSDTPEHNALQVLFLDDEFCRKFINLLGPIVNIEPGDDYFLLNEITLKRFEVYGVDVQLRYKIWKEHEEERYRYTKYKLFHVWRSYDRECAIEIKPSIGDDFPSILRQAMRMGGKSFDGARCVIFRDFVASSVTFEQVQSMFKHSGVLLFSLDDIRQRPADIFPDIPVEPERWDVNAFIDEARAIGIRLELNDESGVRIRIVGKQPRGFTDEVHKHWAAILKHMRFCSHHSLTAVDHPDYSINHFDVLVSWESTLL